MVATQEEIDKKYNLRPFVDAPESKVEIPNKIDLEAIDFSTYKEGPEGLESRQKLAKQLEGALTDYGFFKIVGHGISEETFNKLKAITQSIFELPAEEKAKYIAGTYPIEQEKDSDLGIVSGVGFKPRGHWTYVKGVTDELEFINFRHYLHDEIYYNTPYPEFVQWHLSDIQAYFKYLHLQVLRRVLTLMDIILEIPEGTLYGNYFKPIPEIEKSEVTLTVLV
ncbi:unnamed protein product [Ambrosiozyma monospora]|uniref:Unnamed protein product n=1 Tax=Ambrosiozyma monospora TaxID=43982 RepID=A0ACB5SS52_AMBMO|nr:unnamed protein product [Ambrosiozyma monospora]